METLTPGTPLARVIALNDNPPLTDTYQFNSSLDDEHVD
jgi:hypothetical protein